MAELTGLVATSLKAAPAFASGGSSPAPAAVPQPRRLAEDGVRHHRNDRLDLAEQCYRKALATEPNDQVALHFLGVLRHQQGQSSEAVGLIAKALTIKPNDAVALNNLAVVLEALGRLEEALDASDRALLINPDYAEASNNRGNILLKLARYRDALASYDRALTLAPGYAEALNNRGNALFQLQRFQEALASFDRALLVRPGYAEAHNNSGNALLALNQADRALESFNRALALNRSYAEAFYNRGIALARLARHSEAVASYDRALALKPNHAKAFNNRGKAFLDQGRLDEAILSYAQASAIKPDYAEAHSNLLFAQQYVGRISNAELAASARRFGELFKVRAPLKAFANARTTGRRLRIGYVSGDFRLHPVGFLFASVLEGHDRKAVEVFCYSNGVNVDAMTNRLRAAADHWRSIANLSDSDAESIILQDRIDVLVDLSGHTAFNRLPMFARRAAPVQATWLGYPGTTGLDAIDYLITDGCAVRPGEERWHTEAIVRLPTGRFCYAPPNYAPSPVEPPSLQRGFVTFGSFNNIAKIGPEVIELWSAVLSAVPNSRLLLQWKSFDDESIRLRFAEDFAAAGVAKSRLELEGYAPHAEIMARYRQIDIALDTFPYSGGLTSCEAMWMGVPVLTLPGERAASRHLLAYFDSLGLGDCVARSPRDYIERAVALAADPGRLAALRRALRPGMAASPLCDGPLFVSGLERSYKDMWSRWCRGEPPAAFDVEGLGEAEIGVWLKASERRRQPVSAKASGFVF